MVTQVSSASSLGGMETSGCSGDAHGRWAGLLLPASQWEPFGCPGETQMLLLRNGALDQGQMLYFWPPGEFWTGPLQSYEG